MLLSQAENAVPFENAQQEGTDAHRSLTVSEAMGIAQRSLEKISVRVVGEVSEVSAKAGYKAVYFTIKDADASMPCMMWMNRYRASGIQLQVGMLVELTGAFTLYAPRGRMNFRVDTLSMTGEGELRRRVAQLARKLELEGLMDPRRKRPIPKLPEHVGIVTSPIGDAVHDVLRTFRRRWPLTRISFAGVHVEGPHAPAEIIEGIHACVEVGCEMILLVRGGGSYESLMPFNDEGLARAVAACPIPVVTGIGHEPDNSIADMVADLRASTPTGAALQVTPDTHELLADLTSKAHRICSALSRNLEQSRLTLDRYASRPVLADPHTLFATDLMTLDIMHDRLSRSVSSTFLSIASALHLLQDRLSRALPSGLVRTETHVHELGKRMYGMGKTLLKGSAQDVCAYERHIRSCGVTLTDRFERDLALRAGRLHDLSPLAVIARGYALVRDDQGHIIKKTNEVTPGQNIDITVSDGTIICTVNDADASSIQAVQEETL